MKTEMQRVYIADDGQRFTTRAACLAHETKVSKEKARVENMKVYVVAHSFEDTEGRGYLKSDYIITDVSMAEVLTFCFAKYGPILSSWYGETYYARWRVSLNEKLDPFGAIRASNEKSKVRDSRVFFISDQKRPLLGMEPITPKMLLEMQGEKPGGGKK